MAEGAPSHGFADKWLASKRTVRSTNWWVTPVQSSGPSERGKGRLNRAPPPLSQLLLGPSLHCCRRNSRPADRANATGSRIRPTCESDSATRAAVHLRSGPLETHPKSTFFVVARVLPGCVWGVQRDILEQKLMTGTSFLVTRYTPARALVG